MPAFNPAPVVTLGSGFDFPEGVAVDAKGDVFVADQLNGEVKEIDAVTGGNIVTLGGGFAVPGAVAVDGVGDVFVADDAFATIEEIPASCMQPERDRHLRVAGRLQRHLALHLQRLRLDRDVPQGRPMHPQSRPERQSQLGLRLHHPERPGQPVTPSAGAAIPWRPAQAAVA